MVSLQVSTIMVKKVVTFTKTTPIQDLAKVMAKKNISCVIITQGKQPIGLITERDIMKKIVSKNKKIEGLQAKDIMTSNLMVVPEEENIFTAATLMEQNKIRRLPVVKGKVLKGIITETDVIRAMTNIARYLNEKLIEYITNS